MRGPKAEAAVAVASGSGVRDPEEGTRFVTVNSSRRQLRSLVENVQGNGTGTHSNQHKPRLRDRLRLLIRQHRLDPNLVKSYAADFCGTSTLREASRERLEAFVDHLSQQAVFKATV